VFVCVVCVLHVRHLLQGACVFMREYVCVMCVRYMYATSFRVPMCVCV